MTCAQCRINPTCYSKIYILIKPIFFVLLMSRIPIMTVDFAEQVADWFPRLRDLGYRDFEISITDHARWLISGIKYDHLIKPQPKKSKT